MTTGRPPTVPGRLLKTLNNMGGMCPSMFRLAIETGIDYKNAWTHTQQLIESGVLKKKIGPRGAHIIIFAKMPKRNRNL